MHTGLKARNVNAKQKMLKNSIACCKWLHQEKHPLLPKLHSKRLAYPNPSTENVKISIAWSKWLHPEKNTLLPKFHSKRLAYPNPSTYVLQSSHAQLFGVQDFIEFLNSSRLMHSLSLSGSIVFQTMGPKLRNDLSPFLTDSTLGLAKVSPDLVPFSLTLWVNISFMNGGDKLCLTLNISMATW